MRCEGFYVASAASLHHHAAPLRSQMPYVGARKCPPGSVIVIEVGLIDCRWDNQRIREVYCKYALLSLFAPRTLPNLLTLLTPFTTKLTKRTKSSKCAY